MRRYFTIILLLCSAFGYAANDSIPVANRINGESKAYSNFVQCDKPSLRVLRHDYSLTSVILGANYRNESKAVVPQLGKGDFSGILDAKTFIKHKRSATWGNASYSNGKIADVQFNETNDYAMLYPYILGDSVGGDLRFQNYHFGGGVNIDLNSNWKLGIEAKYRADLAYRQIDPRPKNLVTDLDAIIGASRRVAGKYFIGLDLNAGKYKQTNSLKFFSELGVPNVVHFTGLGTHYYRFQGSNYSNYYKGYRAGCSLGIVPQGSGWHGNVGYKYFTFEKIISMLNELPMARASEHSMSGEIAYLNESPTIWGIKASAEYSKKTGIENIFGDAADNVYPLILSLEQFTSDNLNTKLSSVYGRSGDTHDWSVTAMLGYMSHYEKYNSPSQHFNIAHAGGQIGGHYGFKGKSLNIGISSDFGFYANITRDLLLSGNTIWQTPIRQTYEIVSGHFLQGNAKFSLSYAFGSNIAMSIDIKYTYIGFIGKSNAHLLGLGMGIKL